MTDRLGIGAIETRCAFLGDPVAADALRSTIDHAIRDVLPAMLSETAGPLLGNSSGVIRIRAIKLTIDLGSAPDLRGIARVLARQIVQALRNLLTSANRDVAIWKSYDSYAASYVLHRLGVVAQPDWAFPDFTALRVLAPREAAIEVLAAQPTALTVLAQTGPGTRKHYDGATGLTRADQDEVLRRICAQDPVAPRIETLLTQISDVVSDPGFRKSIAMSSDIRPLALAGWLLTQGFAGAPLAIATVLLDEALQLLSPGARIKSDDHDTDVASRLPIATRDRLHLAGLADIWKVPSVARALRALTYQIERILPENQATAPKTPGRMPPKTAEVYSDYAALALLVPSIMQLGGHERLTANQISMAIETLFPSDAGPLFAKDPIMTHLFQFDPNKPENGSIPNIPQAMKDRCTDRCPNLDPIHSNDWGRLFLAHFASQLPGLQNSTQGYLVREFLHRPGRIDRQPDDIFVDLSEQPLGVVLQMGGHLGLRGTAWPKGPNLTILLKGRAT